MVVRQDPDQTPTKDEVLDDISLYWLTDTATSANRLSTAGAAMKPFRSVAESKTERDTEGGLLRLRQRTDPPGIGAQS